MSLEAGRGASRPGTCTGQIAPYAQERANKIRRRYRGAATNKAPARALRTPRYARALDELKEQNSKVLENLLCSELCSSNYDAFPSESSHERNTSSPLSLSGPLESSPNRCFSSMRRFDGPQPGLLSRKRRHGIDSREQKRQSRASVKKERAKGS